MPPTLWDIFAGIGICCVSFSALIVLIFGLRFWIIEPRYLREAERKQRYANQGSAWRFTDVR
jgi:hypothetical protein